jgi:excinuclease ABC subunit C
MDDSHTQTLTGADYIRDLAKRLPNSSGVYRMMNTQGDVLYVGKAKNLKNRVSSYAGRNALSARILRMVSQTISIEVITTRTEAEALLLEANLIKKYKPPFNILLKDDKSYPYIAFSHSFGYPQIYKHRGAQKKGDTYFGPFASTGAVNQSLEILQRIFLLRPCEDSIFAHRSRPCLQYQIKRCSAPCVERISKQDYAKNVDAAIAFLHGRSHEVQEQLAQQMEQASQAMDYEQAALLRDRIRALAHIRQEQAIFNTSIGNADVIAIHSEKGHSCIQIFFFRAGQHYGNRSFFPSGSAESSNADILEAFIGQYYPSHEPPKLLLLSEEPTHKDILEEALNLSATARVHIEIPKRGDKLTVVQQAAQNAKEALALHLATRQRESEHLQALGILCELPASPERVEVYDNSHIMGTHAIGGMIVATKEGFQKSSYRKFTIRQDTLEPGDDYAMMRQVLTRRLTRLQKEQAEAGEHTAPDLLLIDGGKGHMGIVQAVMDELNIHVPYVCIAKGVDRNAGREWFFMPDREPFQLPLGDALLHYLQRLRDEAHRYAITTHRQKRAKSFTGSELDSISGIGATRKKALLHHFGSARAVAEASVAELERIQGIHSAMAQTIYDYFHP